MLLPPLPVREEGARLPPLGLPRALNLGGQTLSP